MPVQDLVNVREAAELLGCTDARVRQLLLAGDLKGIKATKAIWLIPRDQVDDVAKRERRKGGRPRIGD